MSACLSQRVEVRIGPSRAGGSPRWLRAGGVVLAGQVVALWPVWGDYLRRLRARIDEPWGLVALAIVVVLMMVRGRGFERLGERPGRGARATVGLRVASLLVIVFALSQAFLPPLVAAIIAITGIAITLSWVSGRRFDLSLYTLLLLSLPLSSALQFYLGYPMRSVTAALAAPLLRFEGVMVTRAGTVLQLGEQSIWIDAPCSGVKMLWSGLLLAMTLAAVYRLGNLKTVAVGVLALVAIVLGNVLRSVALFYPEAGILKVPAWTHTGIGLVTFAVTAGAIVYLVQRFQAVTPSSGTPGEGRGEGLSRLSIAAHLAICAAAATAPLFVVRAPVASAGASAFPGWPAQFEGRPLRPEPLAGRERLFLNDFPGRVAKFSDGSRQIIFRWTSVPTRKLHLSSDCFRGAGYSIRPEAAMGSDGGAVRYSQFTATRGAGERLRVRERIYDDAGHAWPDASSWYWAAILRRTRGPWWAVTVVTQEEEGR
jgi:exosortase/archaeosortase family protein